MVFDSAGEFYMPIQARVPLEHRAVTFVLVAGPGILPIGQTANTYYYLQKHLDS